MGTTTLRMMVITAVVGLSASSARAWDGAQLWYEPADAANPGGGGIFGTGATRDYRITCLDCHVERAETQVSLQWNISPPLGPGESYAPGLVYQFTLSMPGESVGTSCGELMDANNVALAFETASGARAGSLSSDSGQSADNCPQAYPDPGAGTTVLYRDCDVIVSQGRDDLTQWQFSWRAPAAGTGDVRVYYGAVDGDCAMDSFGDAVVADSFVMPEGAASASPPVQRAPAHRWWALAALLAVVAIVWRRSQWSRA